ncbi:hypothetical protein GCM10025874_28810 [Arenivirga flava]|uniref:Uncharacterized protein n=1 Tax=Arenivirga flava TaxID=1930060 RepID=A0AA37UFP6_9MICO|nr:hypothetical protein GCM10025874_28810 [Arenivirga flava]
MSDPRYPAAFQRPDGTQPGGGQPTAPVPMRPPRPSVRSPLPDTEVPASPPRTPSAREGNRIVLLESAGDDAPAEAPAMRRNPAIGALYALGAALILLAVLGGIWSQGLLRRIEFSGFGTMLNPDGLLEMTFHPEDDTAAGLARLLVQLAPTTLALGVLALLAAIALPILTRRPR